MKYKKINKIIIINNQNNLIFYHKIKIFQLFQINPKII